VDERQGELHLEVVGDNLSELNNEPGGHRIQRIPPTERRGRVHSSTVTVAVIDPKERLIIEYNDRDFKVEWYSGTGAGGQHRNKHQNSCRLTHLATGEVATSQCRSRENSFEQAQRELLSRLNGSALSSELKELAQHRKAQVGSGERGDKIRTYRFQDDTVKDHRTGKTASCERIMQGNFKLVW
jgi:peptide chain release factor 1